MYPEDLDIFTVGQKSKAAPLVQGTVPSRKAQVTQAADFQKQHWEKLVEMANH